MRVDDFILLGRTVPQKSKKYGYTVCSAGYSLELNQFIRIYPLPVRNGMKQWMVFSAEIERPLHDSRFESWILKTRSMQSIREVGEMSREKFKATLKDVAVSSISQLNEKRQSLGVLKITGDTTGKFEQRNGTSSPDQKELFGGLKEHFGSDAIDLIPYLQFYDDDGPHKLQVREIGAYEWLRKSRDKASVLWKNYRIDDKNRELFLFVGNMANHRNVWLIINVFGYKKESNMMLPL